MNRSFARGSLLLLALLFVGCASVSVRKIDPGTGKVTGPDGLRFYLPRPYLSVFQPFVIGSDVYFAKGEMSADSKYVLLTELPDGLKSRANFSLRAGAQSMGPISIESSTVVAASDDEDFGPEGAPVKQGDSGGAAKALGGDQKQPADTQSSSGGKDTGNGSTSGVLNVKATNDAGAFYVTPQPRYFNIVWLPDFDEQYVVSGRAGLGNAGITMGLVQGWSLQNLDAKIDNSAIAKPLLDFYSGTLSALEKAATSKLTPAPAAKGGPQGASANATAKKFAGGTPVTVKITVARVVAPGLYPILKPSELSQASFSLNEDEKKRLLLPKRPFTNIAFNTYDSVVIEAARTTGDNALHIFESTDTQNSDSSPATGAQQKSPALAQSGSLDAATKKLRIELSKPENTTKSHEYYSPTLTRAGTNVKVLLKKMSNGGDGNLDALKSDDKVKNLVISTLEPGVHVNAADITISK